MTSGFNRRDFIKCAGFFVVGSQAKVQKPSENMDNKISLYNESVHNFQVGHIPVVVLDPGSQKTPRRLVIWINHFGGRKEQVWTFLSALAEQGFVAVSFDSWQHGERGTESGAELSKRVFSRFRKHMWPIIGQTALDASRVIDWAIKNLGVSEDVYLGGVSMGGDIAVAAAGFDHRIKRVAAIIATPDWKRPGMKIGHDLVDQGEADPYANFFYQQLNPITNLSSFVHRPEITFECGAEDDHVPPDGALRFKQALDELYGDKRHRLRVNIHQGVGHDASNKTMQANCLDWFL